MAKLISSVLLLAGACVFTCVNAKGIIDSSLTSKFLNSAKNRENVMISFTQDLEPVFAQVNSMNFSSIAEKNTVMTSLQQSFTNQSQAGVKTFLDSQGASYKSYWINNKIIVKDASPFLVNSVSNIPGVSKVEKEPIVDLSHIYGGSAKTGNMNFTRSSRQNYVAWGVERIRANQVWNSFNGRGIVVANIDSGVRYTHSALNGRWRQSYGWYDAFDRTMYPHDGHGHGTHTMGTIAGSNGIGVAPGATWIACRGLDNNNRGSATSLFDCGEWIQCPRDTNFQNPDCSKAPRIVSNSWNYGSTGNWYDNVIRSWQNAGIIPVVSMGNAGPNCGTIRAPAERSVIAVGSTEQDGKISSFSSLGPAPDGSLKPEISAPGGNVVSSWNTGDTAYKADSGTSMACPHVSGVITLMLQKRPNLNFNQVYNALIQSAVTNVLDTSTARTCGFRVGNRFPNNVFGYGHVDAITALNAV